MSEQPNQGPNLEALVQTIDANPDPLHVDVTPSVLQLIELGLQGAQAVLDLLDAPAFLTRKRAQRVLEGIVMRRHGWVPGQGYQDPQGQEETQAVLHANGDYRADAAPEERRSAIDKWRRWLEAQDAENQR
jgi:hypothetical protein